MSGKTIKVQLIGNYLRPLVRPLKEYGIICGETGSIIDGCSILAMEDAANIEVQNKYIFSPPYDANIFTTGSIMNLQKNLSVRLSREPRIYRQCIHFDTRNESGRIRNDSEYVVIFNSTMGCDLYEKNGMVFSDIWPQNRFMRDIKADSSYRKLSFPFPDYFNWKYYYDKFIRAILREYDSRHIILIRLNSAQWFLNKNEISVFEGESSQWRNRIEEMEEYFIDKTNCLTIDELYNYIPRQRAACAFVYGHPDQSVYVPLAGRIAEVINENEKKGHINVIRYGNPFAKYLRCRLSSDILNAYAEEMDYIEGNWLSLSDICRQDWQGKSCFFQNIVKLQKFLDPENRYTISDLVAALPEDEGESAGKVELDIVELYVQYRKLDINDLIAVHKLCECCDNKRPFGKIIEKIVNNSDALPVQKAMRFAENNRSFLENYPYLHSGLRKTGKSDVHYVELGNELYLVLDTDSVLPVRQIRLDIDKKPDLEQVFSNGLSCSVFSADALCSDPGFYVERTKRKLAGKPVSIRFESAEAFEDSLNYMNYPDLLSNEKFVITLSDKLFSTKLRDYGPVVNIESAVSDGIDLLHLDIEERVAENMDHLRTMGRLLEIASHVPEDSFVSDCPERTKRQPMRISRKLAESLLKNQDVLRENRFRMSMKAVAGGFAIAGRYLSMDAGTHYFIRSMHLGDNVRGSTFLALFRDYHIRNRTFPIRKIVIVTTPNNKDLMMAYRGVDEVITLEKDELSCLREYAASGLCIHNLYDDTHRLIRSWGTPNLCSIYKIPEEYLYQNPEVVRFPDHMADLSMENARDYLEKHGAGAEKSVIIVPYAQSSGSISEDMLTEVISYFNRIGYTVFTNVGLGEEALENTLPLAETPDVVFAMASMGAIMIGIQSGMMDAVEWLDLNIKFIFVSLLNARENIRMFYNAAKLAVASPLPHSLSKRIERRKGAVSIGISTEEERRCFAGDAIALSKVYIKGNLQNNIQCFPDELAVYSQTNLNDYIAEAVKLPNLVIFISVSDSADRYWNAFEGRRLLGLEKDLSRVWRLSYLAVTESGGHVCAELLSDKWEGVQYHYSFMDTPESARACEVYSSENIQKYGEIPRENHCWIYSCAMDKCRYTKSRIVINGIDYSLDKRGLNIVLYSKEQARVIDSITVDTFGDAALTVRRA